MPRQSQRLISRSLGWGLQALLVITAVCVFVPFSPMMPGDGLDLSWALGINQAVAQGLAFGRDIVFTLGPYASIYTESYHPATDHLMVGGSLYLGLSYGFALFLVTRNGRWYLLVALWVVLAGLMYSRDALFFSYSLLVGIFCFKLINSQLQFRFNDKLSITLASVLFFPFGLLPLIKGSFLILCAALAALAFLLFAFNKRWGLAIAVIASPTFSLIFFWVASGQSTLDLPAYIISMAPIISGYTEAMAISGKATETTYYIIAAFVLLAGILREKNFAITSRVFILCAFFVYLFLAFKGGFVRHDGHAIMSGTSLLFAALLFPFVFHSRWTPVILFLSASVWLTIDSHYIGTSTESISRNIKSTYSSAFNGINNRFKENEWLEKNFKNALQRIEHKAKFPLSEGTTDIYSYNQSYLIASGNNWSPRPVFQSYAAYTPSLMQKNKNHLLWEASPDNVILKVEPIDDRIPSAEDGASWLPLLTHYTPSALKNDFLYLHKKSLIADASEQPLIGTKSYSFSQLVPISSNSSPVFVEISIKKSALGKLATIFYKPAPLQISLNLENGTTRTYRIISTMAKSGFLISPLIENTGEFGLLYGGMNYLADKKVKSFSIAPVSDKVEWQDTYEVVFKQISVPSTVDISKLYKFDKVLNGSEIRKVVVAEKCDGGIDRINGIVPAPSNFSVTSLLNVQGWLAKSVEQGLLPNSVLLVLRDDDGKSTFIETRKTPRPDVGAHFQKPALDSSGYVSTADVSRIVGTYTLGLAFAEGDYIKLCPEFKILGSFKGIKSRE